MKNLAVVFLIFLTSSCSINHRNSEFVGEWDAVFISTPDNNELGIKLALADNNNFYIRRTDSPEKYSGKYKFIKSGIEMKSGNEITLGTINNGLLKIKNIYNNLLMIFKKVDDKRKHIAFDKSLLPSENELKIFISEIFIEYDSTKYEVSKIKNIGPFPLAENFKKFSLFEASINDAFLEIGTLPAISYSSGIFATDGEKIFYLYGSNENRLDAIETILKEEGIEINKENISEFIDFFSRIIFTYRFNYHDPVLESDEIKRLNSLPDSQLKKTVRVKKPLLKKIAKDHWYIEYFSLGGWMGSSNTLSLQRIYIAPDYKISHSSQIISKEIDGGGSLIEF